MKSDNFVISLTETTSPIRLNSSDNNFTVLNATVTSSDNSSTNELSIQDQVVIGALSTVAFLSTVAVILRILMPMYRKPHHKVIHSDCKYSEHVISKERRYGQLPSKVSSSSNSSQSSSWSSNSQLDWSDSSSHNTRSTYYTNGSKNVSLPSLKSNFRGSTSSLPIQFSDDRSNRSRASSYLRYINEDPVYILSKKSLEPLQLDETYRNRWDEEFDPLQVTPSGSLASMSHPSEDPDIPDRIPNFSIPSKATTNTKYHVMFPSQHM